MHYLAPGCTKTYDRQYTLPMVGMGLIVVVELTPRGLDFSFSLVFTEFSRKLVVGRSIGHTPREMPALKVVVVPPTIDSVSPSEVLFELIYGVLPL